MSDLTQLDLVFASISAELVRLTDEQNELISVRNQEVIGLLISELQKIENIRAGIRTSTAKGLFPIIAEEASPLSITTSGGFQWSYGNGVTIIDSGIILPFSFEAVAMSLDFTGGIGLSATVTLAKNELETTASITSNSDGAYVNLATPVIFDAGDKLDFKTTAVIGNPGNGLVTAWLRPYS